MPAKGQKHRPESIALLKQIARSRPPKPIPSEKRCSKCREIKPIAAFYIRRDKGKIPRPKERCKKCSYAASRSWRLRNLDKVRVYGRNWKRKNAAYFGQHNRFRRYGLAPEDVKQMLISQKGLCPVCHEPLGERFHIDHDHQTGQVRDILCQQCNCGLGSFEDNPERLYSAITYLKRHAITRTA